MSSILDALKKLEKGKIHRDGISTAIVSDILRSGKKGTIPQWRLPLILFALAILVTTLMLFFFRTDLQVPTAHPVSLPPVKIETKRVSEPVVHTIQPIAATAPVPTSLPLLSGIVYQQQPQSRMVILNDLPVMEGTVVAGYTLHEIFPDHVILTRQGESFSLFVAP
jgi:hypothetical protein